MSVMSPSAAGYPDYQAYPNWRTPNLLSTGSWNLATGTHNVGALITQAYAAVAWAASCSSGFGFTRLSWYSDAALTQFIGDDQWVVAPWVTTQVVVPARGPYVQASVTVQSVANMVAGLILSGENSSPGQLTYPVSVQRIFTGSTSVAAGTTSIHPFPFIVRGAGTFNFIPLDNSAKLTARLVTLNSDETVDQFIADFGAPAAAIFEQIVVPDAACGAAVFNAAATTAHSYQLNAIAGV